MNHLNITEDKLSAEYVTDLVSSPSCGAISLFIGTTRDNFEGKTVVTLEYEAYKSMALKELGNICKEIREKWKNVQDIAIFHRLGTVPVKEASIIIGISSPHRMDAIKATEWCIDTVKTKVPIWKKEVYEDEKSEWKENKEFEPSTKIRKKDVQIEQKVEAPFVPAHLIQIKTSKEDLNNRIRKFMEKKRAEIDVNNIKEFCYGDRTSEYTCARVDAILQKRKDSKSHLLTNRFLNTYHRDQLNSDYLTKHIPPNGVEERLENLECQLSLVTPVPKNIYKRLKLLEDRLLHLESISPEYIQFWDKASLPNKSLKKRVFSIDEIDELIADTKHKLSNEIT